MKKKENDTLQIGGNRRPTLKQRLVRWLLKGVHLEELHIGAHSIVIDGDVIKLNPLAEDPTTPAEGWLWHLAGTSHLPRYHDGTSTKDIGQGATPATHKASHQDGGADALSIAALLGEPAELTTHKDLTTGVHGAGGNNIEHTGNKGAANGYMDLDAGSRGAQNPKLHAAAHTDGSDDIQDATAAQKGLATTVQITKLDGVAAGATVDSAMDAKTAPTGEVVGTTDTQELSGKTMNNLKVKDVDATPVGDVLLKVIDGVLKVRNAGDTADAEITVSQAAIGDLLFKNGYRLTEDEILGVVLISPEGRKFKMIAC